MGEPPSELDEMVIRQMADPEFARSFIAAMDRQVAAADAAGFRRAIEALRDREAFEAWFLTADGLADDATWGDTFAEYLEHLATKESTDAGLPVGRST